MRARMFRRGNFVFTFSLFLLFIASSCGDGSPDVVTIKIPADMVEECWGKCPVPEETEVVWEGEDIMANRLLLGKYAADDYRFRVSKSGFNVLTETDPRNIIFDSTFNILKVYATGTVEVDVDDGNYSGYADVAHSLGYPPMVSLALYSDGTFQQVNEILASGRYYVASSSGGSPIIPVLAPTKRVKVYSATDKIRIQVERSVSAGDETLTFRYYMLIETAATS